jgi:SpoVK/Ycf46/Vps4 family AAA+-type ATPase
MGRAHQTPTSLSGYGDILMPQEAEEPILGKPVRGALLAWLTEIFAEKELEAVGIGPRKRAIFDGPPGVGKTTLAHHLAARLGLPMVAVRPERVISMWMGQTGMQIGALFDAAAEGLELEGDDVDADGDPLRTPVVLFLDEFDAIGPKRLGETRQGSEDERNEYINVLLQRIEQHKGFLIAATNFGKRIDPALWRRFDMHLTLELPGQFEREQILKRYLSPFGMPRAALKVFAEAFETASPALMRQFCEHLKRTIVIGPKLDWDMRAAAVVERLVVTVQPHPDLGKPPMWATSDADHARDRAIKALPWPLPLAKDLPPEEKAAASAPVDGNVVPLHGRGAA